MTNRYLGNEETGMKIEKARGDIISFFPRWASGAVLGNGKNTQTTHRTFRDMFGHNKSTTVHYMKRKKNEFFPLYIFLTSAGWTAKKNKKS